MMFLSELFSAIVVFKLSLKVSLDVLDSFKVISTKIIFFTYLTFFKIMLVDVSYHKKG